MDNKVIGERLAVLRGDRTQKEVAEAINVSISAIAMYESGNRVPRDEIKLRLAKYYNSNVEAIFYAV